MLTINILSFVLAMFFNAVMDTITHHFSTSVFKQLNPRWWDANESWKWVTPTLGTRLDAWHIAKFAMLGNFIICAVTYKVQFSIWLDAIWFAAICGVAFPFFYNVVLRRK